MSWPQPQVDLSSSPPASDPQTNLTHESTDGEEAESGHLRRRTTLNVSVTKANLELRPCQQAYIGMSNARRLLKRATLCKTKNDEPIFTLHEEAVSSFNSENGTVPFEGPHPSMLGYSVHCYAAHAEDDYRKREVEVVNREKLVLVNSINASRRAEGVPVLRESALLNQFSQNYADKVTLLSLSDATGSKVAREAVEVFVTSSGARAARIESPPGMGALATGELWYGGKYRRHFFGVAHAHREDCPCKLRMAFETIVNCRWKAIGIGWSEDGRWIVELGE